MIDINYISVLLILTKRHKKVPRKKRCTLFYIYTLISTVGSTMRAKSQKDQMCTGF